MPETEPTQTSSRFVVISVVFICAVMASYVIDRYTGFDITAPFSGFGQSTEGEAEGSLQHAVDACKQVARSQIGATLLQMRMDSISTRYIEATKEYVVFLNVLLEGRERTDYYFECTVSAVSQSVTRTRLTGPPGSFEQIGI
jgi:hypothetical protein